MYYIICMYAYIIDVTISKTSDIDHKKCKLLQYLVF